MRYIEVLEQCLGRKAAMQMLPLQAGDVPETEAACDDLVRDVGYEPGFGVEQGVAEFVRWYLGYEGQPASDGAYTCFDLS